MIKLLFSKLGGYLATAGAFLLTMFMYKHEKKKRKQAEKDRDAAKANVVLLVKDKKTVTDLDILREKDNKKSEEMLKIQRNQLENLKHETNDNIVVDSIVSMYSEPDNED